VHYEAKVTKDQITEIERAFERYAKRKRERAWTWAIGGFVLGAMIFAGGMFLGYLIGAN